MTQRISMVGAGRLGAPIAAAIASRGHDVIAVDTDPRVVDAIAAGRAPVAEPGLDALIAQHRGRLRATTSVVDAVQASDLTFVMVPTPSEPDGGFSVATVAAAFEEVGVALRAKGRWHAVVLTSTVLPGATRALLPALERHARGRAGEAFGVCYHPVFVALGSVVRDFLHPDFVLIGEDDRRAGDDLAAAYADILGTPPILKRLSFEDAELAKLSINAFVTTKITFANFIAELCAATPGARVDAVCDALGADRRIGRQYLTGGLGFGGPCFPRDNAALAAVAQAAGVPSDLPQVIDRLNTTLPARILARLAPYLAPAARVAVLGLAYKPGANVVEFSQALAIVRSLKAQGRQVRAYDPLAAAAVRDELGAVVSETLSDCVRDADLVVVATPDPAFAGLAASDLRQPGRTVVVIDLWRVCASRLSNMPGIEYVAYGCGPPLGRESATT